MTRKAKRAAIQTAIINLAGFPDDQVYRSPRRKFQGKSPIAIVLSTSEINHFETRGATVPDWQTYGYAVTLYIRMDEGTEDTTEDLLDDLRDAVGAALRGIGCDIGESSAPDGAPLRDIDSILYRVERIPVTIEEYS